jgi:hypothetical protein
LDFPSDASEQTTNHESSVIVSVLFKLREWLTVAEAAKHLTILFGEDVTEADVLRLALDGHLRISIYFVNSMRAERGAVVPIEKAQFREMSLPEIALMEEWRSLEFEVPCPFPYYPRVLVGSYFSDRVVFQPEGGPQLFKGIFDLLLIDDGRQGVEARYQSLTGGAKVDMEFFIDSALLLHDPDSGASLLLCHEPRKSRRYGRGDPLPNDSRLVVRTAALRELEASINAASESPAQPMATTNRVYSTQTGHRFHGKLDTHST